MISRTGENRRLLEIAEILKQRETKILLLTAVPDSSIARLADEVLAVATETEFNELGSMVFLAGAKYMVDILFSVLMARHYDTTLMKNEFYEKVFSLSNWFDFSNNLNHGYNLFHKMLKYDVTNIQKPFR